MSWDFYGHSCKPKQKTGAITRIDAGLPFDTACNVFWRWRQAAASPSPLPLAVPRVFQQSSDKHQPLSGPLASSARFCRQQAANSAGVW